MSGACRMDVHGHCRVYRRAMHLTGSDQRAGEREISRGSINIMEICNNSVPTPVRKFRRRHGFLLAEGFWLRAEMENLPAESHSASG
jgi:hypothetical protein